MRGKPFAPIILASRSERRKRALAKMVSSFRTMAVLEPKMARGKTLGQKTQYLAFSKAVSAARRNPRAIIIAADTLARCDKDILGKPKNKTAAARMVSVLSGRKMFATTSIAIYLPRLGKIKVWSESGWVKFRKIEQIEISGYLSSARWRGKAGAVNIGEKPVNGWISKFGGEKDAVIGLPLKRLRKELAKC